MQLTTIRIDKPDATNFILGQTHFIKSVEDIHETLVGAVPGIKFGLAFCEASGKCLVRSSGTDAAMVQLAQKNAMALGAGHCFIVFLGEGYYPVNVLNAIKMVPEVCRIFCATANPVEVVVPSISTRSKVWERRSPRSAAPERSTGSFLPASWRCCSPASLARRSAPGCEQCRSGPDGSPLVPVAGAEREPRFVAC